MKTKLALTGLVTFILIASCKKHNDDSGNSNTPPATGSAEEKLMDSVYLYSQEVYFWNTVLPSYEQFNPRQYKESDELSSASRVMDAIRKLEPNDRYSFVTTKEESDGIQTGEMLDFGFFVKSYSVDVVAPVDSIYWFVNYVYNQSSAGLNGIKRGWRISKINGTPIGYDLASVDILNNTFFGTDGSASFEFIKPDSTVFTATLARSDFQANSVLFRSVINAGAHKIGYLVFNQFFGSGSRVELATAFAQLQAAGINELVMDLRYNRGGSTETQDTLSNLIAPLAANNQKMYTYEFNQPMQQGNFPLLKQKPDFNNVSFSESVNTVSYHKAGTLNLPRVFFIVSNSTASASELVINNLKPYMDVKLIGDTTYGKPVGFFPIDISNYSIYPISFRTINSAGNADYYSGFAPDKLIDDGVNKDWGDITEPCLAEAIKYISSGSFRAMAGNPVSELRRAAQDQLKPVQVKLESGKFSGMFKEKK